MNFKDVIEWNIPEGSVEEVRDSSGNIIWQGRISVLYHDFIPYNNIYFFNDNPNLIRTDYISTESSNNFFVIGTSEQDLLTHEEQTDINYVVYPQKPNYTILPSPETIGLEIPEGCFHCRG